MNTYIQIDSTRPFPVDIRSAFRILSCNWLDKLQRVGIPNELIIKLYNDHNNLPVKRSPSTNEKINVVYVQDSNSDNEIQNLLNVVAIFNQLTSVRLSIYCEEKLRLILEKFSNEHIQYLNKDWYEEQKLPLQADVIVTYGPGVLHFIKQNIPTILCGPYGLGGWILPDLLHLFLKNGFAGRAGGTNGEFIPVEIFAHELISIKESDNLGGILAANKEIADKIESRPLSHLKNIVEECTKFEEKFYDPRLRLRLIPFMASNIIFDYSLDKVMIKRKFVQDTVCTISRDDMKFFRLVDNENDFETIWKESEMNEDEFWEMIYSLYEKKIILF